MVADVEAAHAGQVLGDRVVVEHGPVVEHAAGDHAVAELERVVPGVTLDFARRPEPVFGVRHGWRSCPAIAPIAAPPILFPPRLRRVQGASAIGAVEHQPKQRNRPGALGHDRVPRLQPARRAAREPADGCCRRGRLRPRARLDVIVVDNASEDGAVGDGARGVPRGAAHRRKVNCGVSGWNDGFAWREGRLRARARRRLLPAGRRPAPRGRGGAGARRRPRVLRTCSRARRPRLPLRPALPDGPAHLLGVRGAVPAPHGARARSRGYDPEIFVWANELEFTLRFFDAGLPPPAPARRRRPCT